MACYIVTTTTLIWHDYGGWALVLARPKCSCPLALGDMATAVVCFCGTDGSLCRWVVVESCGDVSDRFIGNLWHRYSS